MRTAKFPHWLVGPTCLTHMVGRLGGGLTWPVTTRPTAISPNSKEELPYVTEQVDSVSVINKGFGAATPISFNKSLTSLRKLLRDFAEERIINFFKFEF